MNLIINRALKVFLTVRCPWLIGMELSFAYQSKYQTEFKNLNKDKLKKEKKPRQRNSLQREKFINLVLPPIVYQCNY